MLLRSAPDVRSPISSGDEIQAVYGTGRSADDDLAAMRRAFGSWQDHELDGAGWVDRLRPGSRLSGR